RPAMATTSVNLNSSPNYATTSSSSSSPKYKGVRKRKWGKWVSEIRLPNSRDRIWLGSYDTPEKAARAFDAALYCLRGRHANFNFANTPLEINSFISSCGGDDNYKSLSHQEIQDVAARFANYVNDNNMEHEPLPQQIHDEINYGVAEHTDLSFSNLLDSSNELAMSPGFDLGMYSSELHKMHSGELIYSPPFFSGGASFEDNGDDDDGGGGVSSDYDAYSQQSFLWNF
ncbi:Ethylene-responsive transcription factor, partial [Quillaja saponaria]